MTAATHTRCSVPKLPTGIEGFDQITQGGVPHGRCTMISGTSGSGKTLFALQFLVAGIRQAGQSGVIVTFEESPADIAANVAGLGWDLDACAGDGKLAFVDASPTPGEEQVETGPFDLTALLARIEVAVRRVDATRVIIDSVGALFPQVSDALLVRRELHRIIAGLREMGVTTVITVERTSEDGPVARHGVEEFVADTVVILRNWLDQEKRRRTIEILKFRGAAHHKGEFPFTIDTDEGVCVFPLSAMELKQRSSDVRVSSGNADLDGMCGGGLFRDSIILVSGATGAGKTLMVTEFLRSAASNGQRGLLFAFEESRDQLFRNAASWGADFASAEEAGLLRVVASYPEAHGLEDHLIRMKREIAAFRPHRVAVDSLSALERVSPLKSFREFVIGITSFIKHEEIAGLFTNTTAHLLGGASITETHISTITDSIILLRYVELLGEMRRAITLLKMRGSWHDKAIREYTIDGQGLHIGEALRGVSGILAGVPARDFVEEKQQLGGMFR